MTIKGSAQVAELFSYLLFLFNIAFMTLSSEMFHCVYRLFHRLLKTFFTLEGQLNYHKMWFSVNPCPVEPGYTLPL